MAKDENTNDVTRLPLAERLSILQTRVIAPKDKKNEFGEYRYRTKEQIMKIAKPLAAELRILLLVTDDIIFVPGEESKETITKDSVKGTEFRVKSAGRYYVHSTASAIDYDDRNNVISVSAFAREESTKKGMDDAQLSGATSSYAGKYALSNLLGIDDTKDFDATNTHGKEVSNPTVEPGSSAGAKPAAKKGRSAKTVPVEQPQSTSNVPTADDKPAKLREVTDAIKASMLKYVGEGKFAILEKKLQDYAPSENKTAVEDKLKEAKEGKV